MWNVKVGLEVLDLKSRGREELLLSVTSFVPRLKLRGGTQGTLTFALPFSHLFFHLGVFHIDRATNWLEGTLKENCFSTHRTFLTSSMCGFSPLQFSSHQLGVPQFVSNTGWVSRFHRLRAQSQNTAHPHPPLYMPIASPRLSSVLLTNWL